MDDPITPHDVEQRILRLSELLDTVPAQVRDRGKSAAEARHAAKTKEAVAFVQHKRQGDGRPPSDELCKRLAYIDSKDAWLASDVADSALEAAKEAGRDYRTQLDALRSVAANARALTQ